MPRDLQGAETRTFIVIDEKPMTEAEQEAFWRIATHERIETTTTITRHPIPPHAGEETKG